MEQAIKKAIEGGYKVNGHPLRWDDKTNSWWYYWMSEDEYGNPIELENPACLEHPSYFWQMVSKPLFWQALGNSLGWFYPDGRSVAKYTNNDPKRTQKDMWLWHWHRFIDHLAEGKDIDIFFNDLLKKYEIQN